jgi:uncharacterized protein with FMN-binding domain
MKKYAVSSIVIISFIAYSFYQRVFGMQSAPVISTSNSSSKLSQNSPTVTPTPTLVPTVTPAIIQSDKTQTIPTATPIPTADPTSTPVVASGYKDGTYTGDPADAFYGNIQVKTTISGGKITNVQFLQAPNDRGTSIEINSQADPILAQEAIQAQNANVDIVSGATDSSQAFVQSLQSALDQAKS